MGYFHATDLRNAQALDVSSSAEVALVLIFALTKLGCESEDGQIGCPLVNAGKELYEDAVPGSKKRRATCGR